MEDIYSICIHPKLEEATESLEEVILGKEAIQSSYVEIEDNLRWADLYGKTVEITSYQFPEIYSIAHSLADDYSMEIIPMYVYEDFCTGIEINGMVKTWIEISAKTIKNVPLEGIRFLLARQYFMAKYGYHKLAVLSEYFYQMSANADIVPFNDLIADGFKLKQAEWSRLVHYSADNFGYMAVKDLSVCIKTILTLVLNNAELSSKVNIKSYIEQANKIDALKDTASMYTKLDEKVPYGPYRIKNLIAFASSNV